MKKLALIVLMLLSNIVMTFAQDSLVYNITNCPELMRLCLYGPKVIIYAQEGCTDFYWNGGDGYVPTHGNPITIDPQINDYWQFSYNGCDGFYKHVVIEYADSPTPSSFTHNLWKHPGEVIQLEAVGNDSVDWPYFYTFQWNTGETTRTIETVKSDTLICVITGLCGTATRTFIVRDNVELYRASVDLETNLNKTTWQVTEEQAEYISEVKVYRDGLLVGTVPYEQGYFLDAIGSDNAARNYRIVGVSIEGEDCPIESYEKGTIHTTYYQDVSNNLNMTWNIPYVEEGAQGTLTYFQICKYDPTTEELTVVDQVNASITDYTCGVNQFDGGYAVIAAVFNDGKGLEELSFSNLTTDILGLSENVETAFRVYPNPAKDRVTVEGTGILTVTNTLGQTILSKEIDGKAKIDLPQGMYFVELNGITRKIVVE